MNRPGSSWRLLVVAGIFALVNASCVGYSRSGKKAAYVVNSLMIAGGGAAIAADVWLLKPKDCMDDPGCVEPASSLGGAMVLGTMLAVGGLVGIIFTATRKVPSTSR
jgi:hypothetical protein